MHRFLLDEHYPPWLRDHQIAAGMDVVCLTADRPGLREADDTAVLRAATAEGRTVVTEDVSTFEKAIADVPAHAGVIYCLRHRFPRTHDGVDTIRRALQQFETEAPPDMTSVVWWLARPKR
jgi:predicted nuclease of predicted toxin-antitoxin system